MTIGKRKGVAAKGTGKESAQKIGGALSKSDHWYIQEGFGMTYDPGASGLALHDVSGGVINEYTIS